MKGECRDCGTQQRLGPSGLVFWHRKPGQGPTAVVGCRGSRELPAKPFSPKGGGP